MRFVSKNFAKPGPLARIGGRAKGYASDEGGAMIIFGLMIFIIMLVAGGMAVDFMRFERERARVQYTLDRAILASAALSQPLDPESVVRDYFAKSGLENYDLKVRPDTGVNYKVVSASAKTTMNTFFVNLLGIEEMPASAIGAAEERVRKIEISLVLDVSGSMGRNNKLQNLKDAAKEFVDTLITSETEGQVSINIVPYNMQVNAGAGLLNQLNVTSEHNFSHCVDFQSSDFDTTVISSTDLLQRTGHFDPFYATIQHPQAPSTLDDDRLYMCPSEPFSEIMLMTQDGDALKARIDSLKADGNTSIDIGAKWGAFLLDPTSRTEIHGAATIDAAFAERPTSYSDEDAMKILVIMTDGINTDQYELNTDYDTELSNVWFDPDSEWVSLRTWTGNSADLNGDGIRDNAIFMHRRPYNWDDFGTGDTDSQGANCYAPGGNGRIDRCFDNVPFDAPDDLNTPGSDSNAVRLTYQELWGLMSVKYHAYYMQYFRDFQSFRYFDWRDNVMSAVSPATKDDRLLRMCGAFRAKAPEPGEVGAEVQVYTIGYEVTDASAAVLKACVGPGAESNFFRVEKREISDAFNTIAKTIQKLKLTF